MKLSLYEKNPWRLLYDTGRGLENFWDSALDKGLDKNFPACDFHEDKDRCFMSFDLPGIKKENIKVKYENKILTVSGFREEERKGEGLDKNSRFAERFYGSFSRSFNLPCEIDEDKVEAYFSNGVLELALPKSSKEKAREFSIQERKKA